MQNNALLKNKGNQLLSSDFNFYWTSVCKLDGKIMDYLIYRKIFLLFPILSKYKNMIDRSPDRHTS